MFDDLFAEKGLTLERLHTFLKVARHQSYAAVAPENPTTQSQLSRQVGELREYFGDSLLTRAGGKMIPTEAGRMLMEVVHDALRGLQSVRRIARDTPSEFVVAGGDSLLQWWVIPRLAEVLDDVPNTSLNLVALSFDEVKRQLLDGRVDIGFLRGGKPEGLRSQPLGKLGYALFVPVMLYPKNAKLQQLIRSLPLALQTSEEQVNEALRAVLDDDRLTVGLRCETFPQAVQAVYSGRYAAVLPTIARGVLSSKRVREVALPGSGNFEVELRMAWRAQTEKSSAAAGKLIKRLGSQLQLP